MRLKTIIVCFILLFVDCRATIPIKFPQFPEGTQGARLRDVLNGRKKVAVVIKELKPSIKNGLERFGVSTDWSETIRAAMKTQLEKFGYYIVIDIDTRNERYEELARTQTGITQTQKALGLELAVDHFFFVNMTAAPKVECKIENVSDPVALSLIAMQIAATAKDKNSNKNITVNSDVIKPTGVLYLTIFLEGMIVNIESGRSISYSVQEPFRLENQLGNKQCPSQLVAFHQALEIATMKIASKLSPMIVTLSIPLEEKDNTVQAGDKKIINQYLKDGIKWFQAGDIDQAIQSWETALMESGGTSKCAYWNLATAKWYKGDMVEAQRYFDLSIKVGGPKFINENKRKIIAIFKQEKKRIEEEEN